MWEREPDSYVVTELIQRLDELEDKLKAHRVWDQALNDVIEHGVDFTVSVQGQNDGLENVA